MWDLIRKIFLALVIAGLLGLVLYCAYGADYKIGDTLTLQVLEIEQRYEEEGRTHVVIHHYGIQREIINIEDTEYDTVVYVQLQRKDIDPDKFIYHKDSFRIKIDREDKIAIVKFRRTHE